MLSNKLEDDMTDLNTPRPYWRTLATLLWSLVIFSVFGLAQLFGAMLIMTKEAGRQLTEADIMAMLPGLETNGNILTWATLVSFIVAVPAMLLIIKFKKFSNLRDYLALNHARLGDYVKWTLIMLVAVVLLSLVGESLGETSADKFTGNVFKSADSKFLLYVAVAFCAPVFEELFFRGFMYKGLAHGPMGPIGAIVATSLVWAVIHVQYDWFPIVMIFVMGIILGLARWKTNSIYVPIVMHAINNFVSLALVGAGISGV